MADLREIDGRAARALEFTILTAARSMETIGATWDEIDLVNRVWIVPAARMKTAKEHRVPLCTRAVEILQALPRNGESVFGKLSAKELLRQVRWMDAGDATPHGFRSSFRDWAAERTKYANHVVEMALAHAIGSAVEAAYRRGDLFEKRRRLMDDWAEYCSAPTPSGDVVPLRAVS